MKSLEQVLQEALDNLKAYPDMVEELATQLHNITSACQIEADRYGIEYIKNQHVTEVV